MGNGKLRSGRGWQHVQSKHEILLNINALYAKARDSVADGINTGSTYKRRTPYYLDQWTPPAPLKGVEVA